MNKKIMAYLFSFLLSGSVYAEPEIKTFSAYGRGSNNACFEAQEKAKNWVDEYNGGRFVSQAEVKKIIVKFEGGCACEQPGSMEYQNCRVDAYIETRR